MSSLNESDHNINGRNTGFMQAARQTDAVDWRTWEVLPEESAKPSGGASAGRWTRRIVIATAVWSVFELPFEIWASMSTREVAACFTAKLLWVALVWFVLAGSRVARVAYGFLCTIGLMALAFGLPGEYRVFPLGFVLSAVECVLKATAFVCLVSAGVFPDEE